MKRTIDLSVCYIGLLQVPYGKWRAENQEIYALLRDELADMTGLTPEQVQNACEAAVLEAKEAA